MLRWQAGRQAGRRLGRELLSLTHRQSRGWGSGALTASASAFADGQTSIPVLGQVNTPHGTRARL